MSRIGLNARATCLAMLALVSACRSEVAPADSSRGPGIAADSLIEAASTRRLTAGFLIVDGVYNTELTAPLDVLAHTGHHLAGGLGIEVVTVSPDGGTVTTAEGLQIRPDFGFADAPPIDILVVPSAEGSRDADLENEALIEWVRETGDRAGMVVSLCWGAFVLAEAGLLDGRQGTTFPADYASFAERFPEHELLVNVSFVHDRGTVTSQGGARSFDAALHVIDYLYGAETARRVGSGLLLDWPPDPASKASRFVVREGRR